MRIRTGHKPEDWTDNQPSRFTSTGYAAFIPFGDRMSETSELVVGVVGGTPVIGQSEAALHREAVAKHKAKVRAARRWTA